MNEPHFSDTKLDNPLQFTLSRIKKIDFFIAEIVDIEKSRKTLNKYITTLNHPVKSVLFCQVQVVSISVSLSSFTTVIGKPVGIASASINLVFLIRIVSY